MNKSIRYLTLIHTYFLVPCTCLKQAGMKTRVKHLHRNLHMNRKMAISTIVDSGELAMSTGGGTIFRSDLGLKPTPPNLCINCKFFKPDFPFYFNKEFGKCTQFPKIIDKIDSNFFVTGIKKEQKIDYQYCSIVRGNENKCGQEGKFYEEK